jgi:transposase InsO family protein
VRIAFTLDCRDREAICWVAMTGGLGGGDIRDLMIESVERRFGLVNRLPVPVERLSDNGSPYTARETRALAREIGLVPLTTRIESPQSIRHGRSFREDPQARLCTGLPLPRCGNCAPTTRHRSSITTRFTRTRHCATCRRASSGSR